jgi:hypothetical protein
MPASLFIVSLAPHRSAVEVRPVQRGQERLNGAAKLGFIQTIMPAANQTKQKIAVMEIHPVHRLDEAIRFFRESRTCPEPVTSLTPQCLPMAGLASFSPMP